MLSEMLARVCALQKQYGKTKDELDILVNGFDWTLASYEVPEIVKAMGNYIKESSDIPAPADLIKLIEEDRRCAVRGRLASEPTKGFPWEVADKRAAELRDEAMQRFSRSTLATQAKTEGWFERLYEYARDCAEYQARKIAGCNAVPYTNRVYAWDRAAGEVVKDRLYRFLDANDRQAETGMVDIIIPVEPIEYWKRKNPQVEVSF